MSASKPPAIPTRRKPPDLVIELPGRVIDGNNHEISNPTAIRGLIFLAALDVLIVPGVAWWLMGWAFSNGGNPLVVLFAAGVFLHRFVVQRERVMLIISGEFIANKELDHRNALAHRALGTREKEGQQDFEFQWEQLRQQSQRDMQLLLNDNHVTAAREEAKYWQRKSTLDRRDNHIDAGLRPPGETQTISIEEETFGMFSEWLRVAYETENNGLPKGKEPWSNKGEWSQEHKEVYKNQIEPVALAMEPPVIYKSGNRTRLNTQDYPTFTEAIRVCSWYK